MPFCEVKHRAGQGLAGVSLGQGEVNDENAAARLFYRTLGQGEKKILLIMGLAGTHEAWKTQLLDLAGSEVPNEDEPEHPWPFCHPGDGKTNRKDGKVQGEAEVRFKSENTENPGQAHAGVSGRQVCIYDNRGVGKSSVPKRKSAYSTTIMAMDALALLDHLGWDRAHVFGHSMGGMIACKLGAIAPERIASLALISVTGGGWECIPKLDKTMLSISYRFLRAKTPEDRASVDLDTHYTTDYLETLVNGQRRRSILHKEYVESFSVTGMQPKHGLDGHSNACWNHRVTADDVAKISKAGFLVSVIHGRSDLVAGIERATNLARRLSPVARMVTLEGAHFVLRESAIEVNNALVELIEASERRLQPESWCNLPAPGSALEQQEGEDYAGTAASSSAQALPSTTYTRWLSNSYVSAISYLWYWLSLASLWLQGRSHRNSAISPSGDHALLITELEGEHMRPGRKRSKKRKSQSRWWKVSCLQPAVTNP